MGSFVAVGTFHPAIEIWNLDVIDSLEPAATLGGLKEGAGAKKKGKKGKKKAPVRCRASGRAGVGGGLGVCVCGGGGEVEGGLPWWFVP